MNINTMLKNIGGEIGGLRPYTKQADNHKVTYVTISNGDGGFREVPAKSLGIPMLANATGLPLESWKAIDKQVMGYQKDYRSAFNDVLNAGLTHSVSAYTKLFTSQKLGGTEAAVKDMDGLSGRRVDSPTFTDDSVPLFVTHKDFEISWRNKGAFGAGTYDQGNLGIDWDSTMMEEGLDKISLMNEEVIFDGYAVPYAGNYVYGYANFGSRNEVDLTYDWSLAATTSAEIYADVKSMWKETFIENLQQLSKGIMYIHPDVADRFVDDYNSYTGKTLRARLLDLDGLDDIRVSSKVPSKNEVIMVRMDGRSVRIIQGTQGIVPVMWYDNAGMTDKLTLLSIQEPQLRADANGYTSITHGTFS